MVQITVTLEESNLLHELLRDALDELHTEIHHTDDRAYREMLKKRQRMLMSIRERLDSPQLAVA